MNRKRLPFRRIILPCGLVLISSFLAYATYAQNGASQSTSSGKEELKKYFNPIDVNGILTNPKIPDDVRNAVIRNTIITDISAVQTKVDVPSNLTGMMIKSNPVKQGEMPWMVYLVLDTATSNFAPFCGGTLISEKFVLTAAHCLFNSKTQISNDKLEVRINSISPRTDPNAGRHRIANVYIHPNYVTNDLSNDNSNKLHDDLAIVELLEPTRLQPLPLISQDDMPLILDYTPVVIAGWGLSAPFVYPDLQKGDQVLISAEMCRRTYFYLPEDVTDKMVCSTHSKTSYSTICNGDSGSPLMIRTFNSTESKPQFSLLGVVSKRDGDCSNNKPGIHTRISQYREWIKEITGLPLASQ